MLEANNQSVVVLYSASGNSGNVLNAALEARKRGSISIGLIGGLNPKLIGVFDIQLWTRSDDIQLVEDVHAVFGHLIYKALIDSA
jgi:D-sedoheptulose 7-phosphate isomerase